MNQSATTSHAHAGAAIVRWCIEFRECGVWDTLDMADDEETAILLASHYCQFHRDENIRISTNDHRLL